MTTQNYVVLTGAEREELMLFNNEEVAIDPRAIDNASPGLGLNINPDAVDYDPADPITLTGCYVVPKVAVDNPEYQQYAPQMVARLLELPWAMLEDETIFASV